MLDFSDSQNLCNVKCSHYAILLKCQVCDYLLCDARHDRSIDHTPPPLPDVFTVQQLARNSLVNPICSTQLIMEKWILMASAFYNYPKTMYQRNC
ncbi:hypothetical protein K503DRAFT_365127 [Rhizopogon vinicolor AM-OR11-026]|uniref:Uncharacterized protein n=1 Tax=Rhizopogon vinicolor AM-OR11-026 TaxID=1314800 RepID=A0A1B7MSB4_9AGAM|nr:hypothetical protein K503DRAFT_365127 [Rhizopogon vinicolor AM-OR11-026]